jgi:glycosyltransferase involved in cell wall biosynthesis
MRIGVDARELCGRPTGVGRHLAGLLSAWKDSTKASRHSWVLYAPQNISTSVESSLPSNTDVRIIPGSGNTVWEQVSLARAVRSEEPDVFFAAGYSAPLTIDCPTVLVVHDLSFMAHPEWFRAREGFRRRLLTRWSGHRAAQVLTVSDAARREVIDLLGMPETRVRRVYPGVTTLAARGAATDGPPVVLFAGSIFNRRHVPDLIRAFKDVARRRPDARLEIVGDNRTYPYQDLEAMAATEGLAARVSIRSYVSDAELAVLYGRAQVFAFLSEYEGFGHPPLEALTAGVPAVLLDTPVAREVCGKAALYVTRGDTRAIGAAIMEMLERSAVRSDVLAAAGEVLARYSWPRAAEQTLEALECAR